MKEVLHQMINLNFGANKIKNYQDKYQKGVTYKYFLIVIYAIINFKIPYLIFLKEDGVNFVVIKNINCAMIKHVIFVWIEVF